MTALVNKHLSRRAVAPDATQTHRTKVKERTKKPFSPFIARMHTKKREKMTTKQREKTTKLHAPISSRSVAFDRAFLAPGASARAFSCAWSRPDAKIRSKSPVRAFRWTGATSARFRGSPGTFLLLCLSALKMKNSSEFCRENIYQNGICALFFLLFFFIGRLLLRGKDEDTKKERRKQSGFVFVVVFFGRERGAMREQHQ